MSPHPSGTAETSPKSAAASADSIPASTTTILSVLLITAFVMMLNETTVAVALPSMMADYDISATTAQWFLTGFMLTMAVVMPTTGWMLERFTTRAVFIFATSAFLIGTFAAAVAPSFIVMLLARVAQAVGTAVIMPLLMTVTMTLIPPHRRGTIMGLISVVMAVGPALGPTVAGAVLSFTSWHGIFWIMVPLVAIAGGIGALKLTNIGTPRRSPFDLLSVILSVFAFGGLVYGISSLSTIIEGEDGSGAALAILAIGIVGLVLFVWRQLSLGKSDRALLDLRPLAVRNYTVPLIVLVSLFSAMLGVLNTLPLYLQGSLLVTALITGLALLPGGLVEGVFSPIAGLLYDRVGPRPIIIPSMIIAAASLFGLTTVTEDSSPWLIVAAHVVFSIGLAGLISPLMTTALGALPRNLYSHGSAILNTLQQLGGAAGTAVLIMIYSSVSSKAMDGDTAETTALAEGASSAFLAASLLLCAALILSLFIVKNPREDVEVKG